ncbi:MAG: VOC family protein [Marmoricola sp.]
MSRVVHFEIHADDVARARAFYETVFGWSVEDWSEYAGMPYLGVTTGAEDQLGINGAIMQRMVPGGGAGAPVNGAVLTIGVGNFDETAHAIEGAGARARSRFPSTPYLAWRGRDISLTPKATCSAFMSLTQTLRNLLTRVVS